VSQRIKGQETEMIFVLNGKPVQNTTDFKSLEFTPLLEIKQEGYLGEKTDRFDEIFNGVRGRAELHFENTEVFDFVMAIIDRAKRRQPGTKVNMKTTLNFPSGVKKRVLLSDLFFGEAPFTTSSRGDYIKVDLNFNCSDINPI
jgi:hypothetical protein